MNVEKNKNIIGDDFGSNISEEVRNRCHAEYLKDRELFGDLQTGEYKGIRWEARRNHDMGHWCGYFYPNNKLTPEQLEIIDYIAHGGLTANHGFDCAHWNDYNTTMCGNEDMQYRDFPYVKGILVQIIDSITET